MYRSSVHNAERNQASQLVRALAPIRRTARLRALHHGKPPTEAVLGRPVAQHFRQLDAIESEDRAIISPGADRHAGTGVSES